MANIVCRRCGHKFKNSEGERCPYCINKRLSKRQDAEEIIKEVEKILG